MLSSKDMIVFDAFHRFWFHRVCHVLKTQYEPTILAFGHLPARRRWSLGLRYAMGAIKGA